MAIRTLLVDDEQSLLEQAKIFLERIEEVIEVSTASSAERALDMLDEKEFDVIVSDYQMPNIDGLEFLEEVREKRDSDIPFIMFTGKGREEVAMKAVNLGADRYIKKEGNPKDQFEFVAHAILRENEQFETKREKEEREKKIKKLYEASIELGKYDSEEKIYQHVLNSFVAILEFQASSILMEENGGLVVKASDAKNVEVGEKWSNDEGIRGLTYQNQKSYLIDDLSEWEEAKPSDPNFKSVLSIPIKDKGVYQALSYEKDYFDEFDLEMAEMLISQMLQVIEGIRYQDELNKNRIWLSQVMENSSMPTFVIDENHKVTHWNKACENLTGLPKEEIIGAKEAWKAFYDEERPVMADLVLENATEEEIEKYYGDKFEPSEVLNDAYEAEDYFPKMGDDGRWVFFTASPIKDAEGRKIGAIETLQDITERKKAEEKVKEERRKLKTLMDNVPGMVYRCENDRDWTMRFISEGCFQLTGYKPEELIDNEVVSYGELIHPDDRDKVMKEVQEAIDKGEPFEIEYRIKTSSGEVKWVWERGRAVDFEDEKDYLEGLITDITKRKEAEDELTERMSAIEASIDGIAILDEDECYTYLNERHAKIYGYESPEELVGESWKTLYDEEEQKRFENEIMPQLREDGEWRGEAVGMKKDGTKFPQELSLTALENGGLVCIVRDITERVKKESELEKERKKFREIFNNANDAIYLHNLTEDGMPGKFIEVNQTATEMLGYSREEFLEMSPMAIDSGELSDDLQDVMEELIEEGETKFEMVHQAKDGTEIPVEIQSHIFELEGEKRVLSIARDITDRKEVEKRIQENKSKIEKLHEISAELQTYDSEDDVYSFAIEAAEDILDFDICSFDAVEGDKFVVKETSSSTPEGGASERRVDEGSLGSKTYLNQESYLVNDLSADKDAKPEKSEYSSAISIPVGKQGVFQAVSTDIDHFDEEDLKTAELLVSHVSEALKRIKTKDREEFLHSLLRHDVGNKNQIVEGYLELMRDHELSEEVKDFVDKSHRAIKESKEIIQKVRNLRKIDEEREISQIDLSSMLANVLSEHQNQLQEKGINIDRGEVDCKVRGGPLVEELFSNLIENSIQHSNCDKIKIHSRSEGDECVVTVEDDGSGISDDIKEKIFEKGFRDGESAGTGLGLYMVKEIAENYGGSVEVEDSDLGGARFEVVLKKPEV